MEVANASHYDGATATAEAVIMALNRYRKAKAGRSVAYTQPAVPRGGSHLYPGHGIGHRRRLTSAAESLDKAGDFHALLELCDKNTACVVVQNPDFLGQLHSPAEMLDLSDAVHAKGALLAVAVDPISLGMFTPPGQYGADIVMGEGQSLGNPLNFGGPYLGFFAMRLDDVRKSAGRIAGETVR